MQPPRDWDAATYHRVSAPHEEWARSILDRLELSGDERVLDAGCGSGRVTSMLIERLPAGSVVAVDGSPSMVEEARSVLRPRGRGAVVADLTELELDEPVDAVFSNAVFHWVLDHDALFRSLRGRAQAGRAARRPERRRRQHRAAKREQRRGRRAREPYARPLRGLRRAVELRRAGGDRGAPARAPASPRPAAGCSPGTSSRPSPPSSCARSASARTWTACPRSCATRSSPTCSRLEDEPLVLDYVRLNIERDRR